MNRRFESHAFWGSHTLFSALSGIGLAIMASTRFAFALVSAGALIWVYGLGALIFSNARPILPRRGRMAVLLFLSAFLCGVYMLLAGLFNPLLILGTEFFLILIPSCCLGSGFFEASESEYPAEVFTRALVEAAALAGIILALALIREPLGMGTLSFPGGAEGVRELFGSPGEGAFVPVRLLSVSAGGLMLFGYGTALFRSVRARYLGVSEEG